MKVDVFTLAHEVRNPLAIVKGYNSMLNQDNIEKYKDIIDKQINEAIDILDNYLLYNKIVVHKEIMDINVLLSDLYDEFYLYLKDQKIKFEIFLEDDEIFIEADYNKLKQVFANIIKNSIEAKSSLIQISYSIIKSKLVILVKDNGQGIERGNLEKLNSNISFSSKVLGNGIGTMVSKKIIELHNGKIQYDSLNNVGTSVEVILQIN